MKINENFSYDKIANRFWIVTEIRGGEFYDSYNFTSEQKCKDFMIEKAMVFFRIWRKNKIFIIFIYVID
jgi:hypothetical protein